jgi:homoserine dehydrogenase
MEAKSVEQVQVALLGLGTVGTGVFKMIQQNQDLIARRTGKFFNIRSILVKNLKKKRELQEANHLLTDDYNELLRQNVHVVIEAIGGVEPARTYLAQAIKKGCHVVTANKELIAKHGQELENLAEKHGVRLLYEASVGGGIPVIGTLEHFLKANRVYRICGILNGTTNYILSQMSEQGRAYVEVLREAQERGYAEADPSSDVEGRDAAYKLSILIRLAFDADVPVEQIRCRGITDVTSSELELADRLGYTVKLLAQAEQFGESGPIACSVYPTLIPKSHLLSRVNNVYNAIYLEGDKIQDLTLIGQGAGEKPTASAMVEDLCNIERWQAFRRIKKAEPWIIEGAAEAGTQFIYLSSAAFIEEQFWKQWVEQWRKRGIQLLGWALRRDAAETKIGFIAGGWNDEAEQDVIADLGWDVKIMAKRPVFLGGSPKIKAKQLAPLTI